MATPTASNAVSTERSAVLLAAEGEMRVLLRGLLRLNRFRVLGEAAGWDEARGLLRSGRPTLLLVDEPRDDGALLARIAQEREGLAPLRVVLISAARPAPDQPAGGVVDAVLPRPFRLRDFAGAVDPDGRPAGTAPGP